MKTILAIDDQKDNLVSFQAIVKSYMPGCTMITAQSGQEGIEIARKEHPDVILLDIIMPEMNGFDTCSRLKADPETRRIPVIMVTAIKTDTESKVKALESGAEAFLTKPVDPTELTAQVNVMLRIKHAEDRLEQDKLNLEQLIEKRSSELFHSELRYRTLTSLAPVGVYQTDQEGKCIYVNQMWQEMTGLTPKEAEGDGWVKGIYSGDREMVFQNWNRMVEELGRWEMEYRFQDKEGRITWVYGTANKIVNDQGEITGYIGVNTDITERKKAEDKISGLSKILENSLNEVYFFNSDTYTFVHVNRGALNNIGYSYDEMVKMTPLDIKPEFTVKQFESLIMPLREEKVPKVIFETIHQRKDKSLYPVEVHLQKSSFEGHDVFVAIILDITVRKQADRALKESEENFRELVKLLPQIVFETDLEGKLTYVNQQAYDSFNYTVEDFNKGLNAMQMIVPLDRERAMQNLQKSLTGEGPRSSEYTAIRKDGTTFSVLVSSNPIIYDNKPVGLRGIIIDITERKRGEEALRVSEERFQKVAESAGEWIWEVDTKGLYTYSSPVVEIILGYKPEEVVGKKHFYDFFTPDLKQKNKQAAFNVFAKKESFSKFENLNIHKNGSLVFLETSGNPILDQEGNLLGYRGADANITERKKAERTQRILYNISNATNTTENLEELFKIIREELSQIINTSNFFVALYEQGADSIEVPYIVNEKEIFSEIPLKDSLTGHVIKSGGPLLITHEMLCEKKQFGNIKAIGMEAKVWLGVPLKLHGAITGAIVVQSYDDMQAYGPEDVDVLEFVSHQISLSVERKKREEELKTALKKATESDRLKSSFLATMSHELRTPLNAVIGFSDLIDETFSMKDIMNMNRVINKNGNHLLNIIEDIFDISLIETGEIKIDKEEFDLVSFINGINDLLPTEKAALGKQHLNVTCQTPQNLKRFVLFSDQGKLKQILLNLLKNALKYTPDGSVEYGFIVEEQQDKPFVKFFVKDTGIGISQDLQKIIFEPFRQADESHTRLYGGTGLGLSISKKLTNILGGEIWVESEVDKGSAFYFTIPSDPIKAAQPAEPAKKENEVQKFPGKTILIVEDEDSNFEYLEIILKRFDIQTVSVNNGRDAIDLCSSNPNIDLVLMDIKMPVMNGYEATAVIKKNRPDLPVIAQTAHAISGDRKKALRAGCDDYISKPITKEELNRLISNYLK